MADDADWASSMAQREIDAAVRAHGDRGASTGAAACIVDGCGEPVSDLRRQMGARLCLACANAAESAEVHMRTWRRC